jgi:hypothetical protein
VFPAGGTDNPNTYARTRRRGPAAASIRISFGLMGIRDLI